MKRLCLNKMCFGLILILMFSSTSTVYARSLFQNKKVDYKKLSTQKRKQLKNKQLLLRKGDIKEEERRQMAKQALSAHLQNLTQIHIPAEVGRILEVYDADADRGRSRTSRSKLIVHIQDLHTNPEGQLNLAKILETVKKDYGLDLVCSEGAEGKVDTSSVSSFPDAEIRRKTAMLFIKSGELTGEEYLSITKYPDLPIWGIEDSEIYFKNIDQFNEIMKINQASFGFIEQTTAALEKLKPKIYHEKLLEVDKKEHDFETETLKTDAYLAYLTTYLKTFNIPTDTYRNISILNKAVKHEDAIDQQKIMQASQQLLSRLQTALSGDNSKKDMEELMIKAQLFKDQKISPFSFYSYLEMVGNKYVPDKMAEYKDLTDFVEYLSNVNSLDTTKLFNEMAELTFDIKMRLCNTEEQKDLTRALRNIKYLEGFFNLKVSNDEYEYYLAHKDSHTVAFFERFLVPALKKYKIESYVDFNADDIDAVLPKLEAFYQTVKARDVSMYNNSMAAIEAHKAKVAALVSGGFHTKGLTAMFREAGISYIVVAPFSDTEIDEENYHFLLSGQRKPISELLEMLDEDETPADGAAAEAAVK